MVMHSERIILLGMFYKAYLNVYYFYYSIKEFNCVLVRLQQPAVSVALLRVEFGIQNHINKLSLQRTTKILI